MRYISLCLVLLCLASCGDEGESSSEPVGPEGWQDECDPANGAPVTCPEGLVCQFSRCTIICEEGVNTECVAIDPSTECYTYEVEINEDENLSFSACLPVGLYKE